ncbi:MAG: DoxX family protein [Gemmataceae bacterium]|nr:DoxX family protein [Gemmataceae bacterium]
MTPDLEKWLLGALGLTAVLLVLSLLLGRKTPGPSAPTRFLLVALRLAIGWHCFVEGMDKLHTPGWTGEGYLREAYGPLAGHFRDIAGDRLIDKLTLTANNGFPEELDLEWQAYLEEFSRFYDLTPEQSNRAKDIVSDSKADTLTWLREEKKPVQRISDQPPPLVAPMTIPERLKEHEKLTSNVRNLDEVDRPKYGKEVFPDLKAAKTNLNRWRGELKRDLDQQTRRMKTALMGRLLFDIAIESLPADFLMSLPVEHLQGLPATYLPSLPARFIDSLPADLKERITPKKDKEASKDDKTKAKKEKVDPKVRVLALRALVRPLPGNPGKTAQAQKAFEHVFDTHRKNRDPDEPVPYHVGRPMSAWKSIDWSDAAVKWGLTVVGGLLIAGLFTRLACVAGAAYLLMFFLAMPPLPGWPEPPRVEGHYLYINKNIIEMLALLTLATTRSGRWLGVDGLLQLLWPSNWRSKGKSASLNQKN